MKKLLYGFIFSLMLFSYADAQIATDQIYGGVYTKAEVDGTIENAVSVDASGFDGNLATTDDTVQKVAQKLDDLDTSAVKVITVDGDSGTTGSTVKLVSGTNVTITRTDDTVEIAAIPTGGGIAIEDEGTYISGNTIWEFDTEYDTTAVMIFRNRLIQPRKLFTSSVVSSKTRVTFLSAINASDEIILISNK